MFQYDFSNHQNRHIRITDMPAEYFQRIQETTRKDPYYPVWHIAPKCGLMNDPNGLCEINGIHHIFLPMVSGRTGTWVETLVSFDNKRFYLL